MGYGRIQFLLWALDNLCPPEKNIGIGLRRFYVDRVIEGTDKTNRQFGCFLLYLLLQNLFVN